MLTLPDDIKVFLAGLVGFFTTQGLKEVGNWIGVDLSGNAAKVTALLMSLLVYLVDMLLALIPDEYKPLTVALFSVLGSLLTMLGAHYSYKALKRT